MKKIQNDKKRDGNKRTSTNEMTDILFCAVMLCVIMSLLLYIYNTSVPSLISELEAKKDMEQVVWLVRYGSLLPPVPVLALCIALMFAGKKGADPVTIQKKKAWISLTACIFTYGVLMTYAVLKSPEWYLPQAERQEQNVTLFENTWGWFFAQIIPFVILISYHFVRASSKEKELFENERI